MRPSAWQIVVIVLIIVVMIGWKRLPDVARSVGRSLRIFKSEVEQLTDKDDDPSPASRDTVESGRRRDDQDDERRRADRERPEHRSSGDADDPDLHEQPPRPEGTQGEQRR